MLRGVAFFCEPLVAPHPADFLPWLPHRAGAPTKSDENAIAKSLRYLNLKKKKKKKLLRKKVFDG